MYINFNFWVMVQEMGVLEKIANEPEKVQNPNYLRP